MGEVWHSTGRGLYIFIWTGERGSSVRDRFFFVRAIIASAVRRVAFISNRKSDIILRGRCAILLF
jgi:hypothetical protein